MVAGNEGFVDGGVGALPAGVAFEIGAVGTFGAPPVCAEAKRGTAIALARTTNHTPRRAAIFAFAINPRLTAVVRFFETPLN
jgi:hypothetical protein